MGIFEDFKETKRNAEFVVDEAQRVAVSKALEGLEEVLAEPIFRGDIDTALVHYLREDAFRDDQLVRKYQDFAKKIEEEKAKNPAKDVPLLILFKPHPEANRRDTAFVRVASDSIEFESRIDINEVVTHAFAGEMVMDDDTGREKWQPQTGTITDKSLYLVGSVDTFSGDLLEDSGFAHESHSDDGFVLKESHTTPGGGGIPSEYGFSNYSYDKVDEDGNSFMASDMKVIIGWEAIDKAPTEEVVISNGRSEKAAQKLVSFIEGLGHPLQMSPIASLPRSSKFARAYLQFQASV